MILGTGVDIVEVERIRGAVDRYGDRFIERIFSEREAEYCRLAPHPEQRFATRFAAKEAALKALGVGWQKGTRFRDVEVSNDSLGAPSISFSGKAGEISHQLGVVQVHVSLSHHKDFAIAHVLLEGD
jgi:holo-[acyl-carrier protein] synthase